MSKIFIAYQFRGENVEKVENWLKIIKNELERRGIGYFCSFWKEKEYQKKNYTVDQIISDCLESLKECKTVIFLIRSIKDSAGMKMELDLALKMGKKIIVIIKPELEFHKFRRKADKLVEIKGISELKKEIRQIEV